MTESKVSSVNRTILMAVIMTGSFSNAFMAAAVNIAIPVIAKDLSMNAFQSSWVATSFLLSSAMFLVPFGKIGDIYGRKKIFLIGNVIFAISSLLCIFSETSTFLIVLRFIQGIGGSMIMSTAMAMVTSEFPAKVRGKMIGMVVSSVYLGLTLAPVIGGFLTQHYGWESIFIVNLIAGTFVIFATVFSLKVDWAEAADEMFDYKGSVLYMISVFAMMYGFSKLPDIYGIVLTTSGIICLVLFILIERKVINPVLDIKLFLHNRIFAFSNLAALINYAATFAITFMLSLYLQYVKDMEPRDAGLILITQPAVMAFTASLAGRLSDKIDSGILASVGMGIIVFGLILLCFIDADTEKLYLVGSLIIIGLGFGAFSTPNTNSVMSSVDKRFLGVASATQATMRLIGQILSMSLAAMIIHIFLGDAKITDSNEHLFMSASTIIFIIFAILCFIGIFASLARGKRSSPVQDN